MAHYKKRPKVKRYRRSFYSREMKLKKGIGIAVLVLAVLGIGWLAAPHVLDWATHTWYTVVRNRDLSASSPAVSEAASSTAASEAAASSVAEPEPAPEPEPTPGTAIVAGNWAEVDVTTLTDEAAITAAAQQLQPLAQPRGKRIEARAQRIATLVGGVNLSAVAPQRLDANGDAGRVGGDRPFEVAVARNVVPQTRFAALEPLTRSHVVQKPPLLLADLLGHGIVHITQVEGLRLLHGHRLPAGEIIRDSLADGRGIQRRIHFQQVGTHVETDDISHRIGIGVQFHPAAAFGTTAPQRQHQDRKDRKSFHIVGRFNSLPQAS